MNLPIDLIELTSWCLSEPLAQLLVSTPVNAFFAPNKQTKRVVIREEDGDGCWGVLPEEWRLFFEGKDVVERRKEILKALALGESLSDFPQSLSSFLRSCRTLSLDRTCSKIPIVSHPPRSPSQSNPSPFPSPPKRMKNKDTAGLSPKKHHEVLHFGSLVEDVLSQSNRPTHALDVGSGRAHLSRVLALPPISLNVLAVDWSPTQTSGATRLEDRTIESSDLAGGSLTYQTSSLDAPAIEELLATWPSDEEAPKDAMLVALHACGDLTVDALKAFINSSGSCADRKAICVGCCYNLMSEFNFPLSKLLPSFPTPPLVITRDHLRVSPQSPSTWYHSQSAIASLSCSILKIAFRARLEAELDFYGHRGERSIGRLSQCSSYTSYRTKALAKYGVQDETTFPPLAFGSSDALAEEEWAEAVFKLQVFWTLRSWLGPPLESLLLLDRFAFVVEGLGLDKVEDGVGREGTVELINLFDQASGSMRNVAIVVR